MLSMRENIKHFTKATQAMVVSLTSSVSTDLVPECCIENSNNKKLLYSHKDCLFSHIVTIEGFLYSTNKSFLSSLHFFFGRDACFV